MARVNQEPDDLSGEPLIHLAHGRFAKDLAANLRAVFSRGQGEPDSPDPRLGDEILGLLQEAGAEGLQRWSRAATEGLDQGLVEGPKMALHGEWRLDGGPIHHDGGQVRRVDGLGASPAVLPLI